MGYGYKSSKYNLPSVVEGDYFSASEEQRKVDIIDRNLEESLYLLTDGSGCGIIDEGIYSGIFVNNASTVTLSESKPHPVIEALISEVAIRTTTQLSWVGLLNNQIYYLYITLTETDGKSSRQYGQVITTISLSDIVPLNSILVATAITTASTITINSNPTGKKNLVLLQTHTLDDTNPHGTDLTQTNLTVSSLFNTDTLTVTGRSTLSGITFFHSGVTIKENLNVYKGIDVNNQKITSLLPPTVGTDAANKNYVDFLSGIGFSGIDIAKNATVMVDKATTVRFSGIGVNVSSLGEGIALVDIAGNDGVGIAGIGIELKDNTVVINDATVVRFSGVGVNVTTMGSGRALVDIPGSVGGNVTGIAGIDVEGINLTSPVLITNDATIIRFSGIGVNVIDDSGSGRSIIDIPGAVGGVGGGISSLVEDTTPQLGGELDSGAHSIGFTQQTATGDGTTTIDWRLGNKFFFTFGNQADAFTFTAPSKPCSLTLVLKQYSTGGQTATFSPTPKWAGAAAPTLSIGNNAVDILSFYWDGSSYYGCATLNFA